jgi:hypothetical protein
MDLPTYSTTEKHAVSFPRGKARDSEILVPVVCLTKLSVSQCICR